MNNTKSKSNETLKDELNDQSPGSIGGISFAHAVDQYENSKVNKKKKNYDEVVKHI